MLDLNKKKIPRIQGQRRSPNNTVGEAQSHLKWNLRFTRENQRRQTKLCAHEDEGKGAVILQETEPDLSLRVWVSPVKAQVSSDLLQGQQLRLQQPWEAWRVASVLSEEVAVGPTIEPLSRWHTNWRIVIPKKFSHCSKSSRAQNRFPNLRIQQQDWEPPANLTVKASGIWLQNFHRTGETDSWRTQQNLEHTRI